VLLITVVGHEDENRVLGELQVIQFTQEFPDILIDVLHHAVHTGGIIVQSHIEIGLDIAVGNLQGGVRCVGGDIGKKGAVAVSLDILQGGIEKDIGAVAFKSGGIAIQEKHGVLIHVAGWVGRLS